MNRVKLNCNAGPIGGTMIDGTVVLYAHDDDGKATVVWPEWVPTNKPGQAIGSIDGAYDASDVEAALRRLGAGVLRAALAANDSSLVGLALEVDLADHGARRYLPVEIRGLESAPDGPLHEYWRGRGYECQLEIAAEDGHVVVTVLHPDPGAWYRAEPGAVMRWCSGNIDRTDFVEWVHSLDGRVWANRAIWGRDDPDDCTFDELAGRGWSYLPTADFVDLDDVPDDHNLRAWAEAVWEAALESRVILSDDPVAAAYDWREQHPA
jgi:hypothetical protein